METSNPHGYVMPVSPYFAEDGASVVDWEAPYQGKEGMHISPDEGYRTGIDEREEQRNVMSRTNTSRRTGRRPGM